MTWPMASNGGRGRSAWARARARASIGSIPLDAEGDAHAAADTQGGEALLGVALLHFVEKGGEDAGARGADRVADRDRAAVDVDLVGVPAELLADRERLGGERLIGFDEVEIGDRPAGFLERALRGGGRTDGPA